jgi:lipoprotein Spr
MKRTIVSLITLLFLTTTMVNCAWAKKRHHAMSVQKSHPNTHSHRMVNHDVKVMPISDLNADSVKADSVLSFAQTLLGKPYREASSNPLYGFDCSGFVSYVFKSFSMNVPRSSDEYYNVGEKVALTDAKPGDVILFTGTKSHHPHSIGHVGIVFSNDGNELKFIHSTSGKEYCVTISTMDDTYKRRFVQIVRLLKQNDAAIFLAAQ